MKESADWQDPRRTAPLAARAGFGHDWRADNPIAIIYRDDAQWLICRGCRLAVGPRALAPMPLLILFGREFVRDHRFCKPQGGVFDTITQMFTELQPPPREPGE